MLSRFSIDVRAVFVASDDEGRSGAQKPSAVVGGIAAASLGDPLI